LAEGLRLTVSGSPICRRLRTEAPACHYYVGTFERLFAATLGPGVRVVETACVAAGAAECHFEVTW
jgi:divinyl protochlorophyllide a 8-vinyl-reductase